MPGSPLAVDYPSIAKEVSWEMGYGRDISILNATRLDLLAYVIAKGMRQVYWPPPTEVRPGGVSRSYRWRFMQQDTAIDTVIGQGDYQMPEDFGGVVDVITFQTTTLRDPIEITGEQEIRRRRQNRTYNARPFLAAQMPRPSTGALAQQFDMQLYPTPDAVYTLEYTYHVVPWTLDADHPYPLGGDMLGQLFMESCLGAVEQHIKKAPGIHTQLFGDMLRAAIVTDRTTSVPHTLGYNADRSDSAQTNRFNRNTRGDDGYYVTFAGE